MSGEESLVISPAMAVKQKQRLQKIRRIPWRWNTEKGVSAVLILSMMIVMQELCSVNGGRTMPAAASDNANRFPDLAKSKLRGVAGVAAMRSSLRVFREAPAFRNGKECYQGGNMDLKDGVLGCSCDPTAVQIAMTLDAAYLRGSVAGILSVLQHTACPENVVFNFVVSSREEELKACISATFPYLRFKFYHFDVNVVKDKISGSIRQVLDQPLNYARIYLADILPPCVKRVVYLDSDLIVVNDIGKLWRTNLGSRVLAAPEYCHANFTNYFTDNFWEDPLLPKIFEGRNPCYFNTGVIVMDLGKWRDGGFTKEIERWMELHKERRLYELGSLPPFLLVFGGLVEKVDHEWNQHGLGGDNLEGRCRDLHPGPVSLLHWSGKGKPWLRLDSKHPCPLDSLWAPYDLYLPSTNFLDA